MTKMNYLFKSKKIECLYKIVEVLAPKLPYHNLSHLIDVADYCRKYASFYKLKTENVLILETTGLLHDIIYENGATDNEEKSAELAKKILSSLDYNKRDIEKILRLILATKFPREPKNLLEKIICDSDLDYLGRQDFFEKSELLRIERGIDKGKWCLEIQPSFLSQVKYHTFCARIIREPVLKENLAKIRRLKC